MIGMVCPRCSAPIRTTHGACPFCGVSYPEEWAHPVVLRSYEDVAEATNGTMSYHSTCDHVPGTMSYGQKIEELRAAFDGLKMKVGEAFLPIYERVHV